MYSSSPTTQTIFCSSFNCSLQSGGGSPSSATIVVNGFQNGSAMPPKNSIASIRINADLFSAEYDTPPWSGGRVEIFTKPGADRFHGALFFTDSESGFNATDPFSVVPDPTSSRDIALN